MSRLGKYLREEREKRGLSLHEIGLSLKINPKILAALEEGQHDGLPAKTFLRGFVKSYAQYLRLDTEKVLSYFNDEFDLQKKNSTSHLSIVSSDESSTENSKHQMTPDKSSLATDDPLIRAHRISEPNKTRQIIYATVGILAFLVLIVVAKMVEKYQKERSTGTLAENPISIETTLESGTNNNNPSSAENKNEEKKDTNNEDKNNGPTENTVPFVKGAAAPTEPLMTPIKGQNVDVEKTATPTPIASPSPTSTPVAHPTPKVTPSPVATATPAPAPTSTPKPTPTPKPSPTPAPQIASPTPVVMATPIATPVAKTIADKPTEIIIEALDTVTVTSILSDGKKQTVNLEADKLHTIRTKGAVKLEISNGAAVNLIVNGRDRGMPGAAGKPIKLTVP